MGARAVFLAFGAACAVLFCGMHPQAHAAKPDGSRTEGRAERAADKGALNQASNGRAEPVPLKLTVPGRPPAYYFKSRKSGLAPVLMYLHGRGGRAAEDCMKWARIATEFGWLVCPQAQEEREGGGRTWNNSVPVGKDIADAALQALRDKYKGKVQLRDNVLIGFSEGAYIAMQMGVMDPRRWSRWLILAANDQYWFGEALGALRDNGKKIRRVYLLTGEADEVAPNTKRVGDIVKGAKIPVRVDIATGLGHELAADRFPASYRRPLAWLLSDR
jgi:predicted esterase